VSSSSVDEGEPDKCFTDVNELFNDLQAFWSRKHASTDAIEIVKLLICFRSQYRGELPRYFFITPSANACSLISSHLSVPCHFIISTSLPAENHPLPPAGIVSSLTMISKWSILMALKQAHN